MAFANHACWVRTLNVPVIFPLHEDDRLQLFKLAVNSQGLQVDVSKALRRIQFVFVSVACVSGPGLGAPLAGNALSVHGLGTTTRSHAAWSSLVAPTPLLYGFRVRLVAVGALFVDLNRITDSLIEL